eukprot:1639859-Amphidinium_carterae.1
MLIGRRVSFSCVTLSLNMIPIRLLVRGTVDGKDGWLSASATVVLWSNPVCLAVPSRYLRRALGPSRPQTSSDHVSCSLELRQLRNTIAKARGLMLLRAKVHTWDDAVQVQELTACLRSRVRKLHQD